LFEVALLVQTAVKVGAKKIEAFGELDENKFREKLNELLDIKTSNDKSLLIPLEETIKDKISVLYNVFSYSGGCSVLPSKLHVEVNSGSPLCDSRASLECNIGQKLDDILGGILKVNSSFYAVTAGHCLLENFNDEIENDTILDEWNVDKDIGFIKLKQCEIESRIVRNNIASDPNHNLYFFDIQNQNFPFIPIETLEPGVTVHKMGKETGFTSGIYEGIKSVRTKIGDTIVTRNDAVVITALSDTCFSKEGDSGSVYYAVRGSFRYPIAVNNGEGYDLINLHHDGLFDNNKIAKPIFFGTPLVRSIEKYWSLDESSWSNR
jgi:hypothetical protein